MHFIEEITLSSDIKRLSKKHNFNKSKFDKALTLLKQDIYYPSLHFKPITCKENKFLYSFRINNDYRVFANYNKEKEIISIFKIVTHNEYNKIVKNC
jgi:mRNA-degrading endonuclease RelE of RelBE toxin-antitoxin system